MIVAKPLLVAALVVGIGYAASPYVTLYRLGHAVQSGDATELRTLVNWPSVRQGIKEDICDRLADTHAQAASDTLPAFGASFVRGIATNAVDQQVTPQHLLEMTRHDGMGKADRAVSVSWAFFQSPLDFVADIRAPGQPDPIRLQMTLKQGGWQVTRIRLPHDLLEQANGT